MAKEKKKKHAFNIQYYLAIRKIQALKKKLEKTVLTLKRSSIQSQIGVQEKIITDITAERDRRQRLFGDN